MSFSIAELKNIMQTCIILHNMIIEDERDHYDYNKKETFDYKRAHFTVEESSSYSSIAKESVVEREADRLLNNVIHHQLQNDLIQYNWNQYGNSAN